MIGVILLISIAVHELYLLLNMKKYKEMEQLLNLSKERNEDNNIFIKADIDISTNSPYFSMYILGFIRFLVIISLLFTQYWLIALVLIVLGFIVYRIKKSEDNIYVNYLGRFSIIITIILGLIMI